MVAPHSPRQKRTSAGHLNRPVVVEGPSRLLCRGGAHWHPSRCVLVGRRRGKVSDMAAMPRPDPAGDPDRVPARWAVLVAVLGLLLAAPVATWWLVGDLSTVPVSDGRDYAFRPWP